MKWPQGIDPGRQRVEGFKSQNGYWH